MKIQLGNYELIYSSNLILIEDYPIQVTLPDDIEGNYEITFRFIKNELNKSPVTNTNAKDKFHLNVDFVNFFGPEEIGNVQLLELGTLRKYPLFVSYRINSLRGASRTVLLNFYLRKEV